MVTKSGAPYTIYGFWRWVPLLTKNLSGQKLWPYINFGLFLSGLDMAEIVRATAEQLSQDLAGDPKHIYKRKIRQESAPSRGSLKKSIKPC